MSRLVIPILTLSATSSLLWQLPQVSRPDFYSFVASGRAVLDGRNPYDPSIDPTLTPPFTLPLFSLLARFDRDLTFSIWCIASAISYALILAVLLRAYPQRRTLLFLAWAAAYMPLWYALQHGQVYIVLLWLTAAAWLWLQQERYVLAGLAIGLLIGTKPNFALWPAMLFLAGYRLPALISFGVTGVLTIAPLFWYGPGILLDWLAAGTNMALRLAIWNTELSLRGLGNRLGLPVVGIVLAAALSLLLLWWAKRHRPDVLTLSRQGLVGAILAAPVMWPGYALVLLPAFAHERWSPLVRFSAGALAVPYLVLFVVVGGVEPPVLTHLPALAALAFLLSAAPFDTLRRHLTRLSAPTRMDALSARYSPPSAQLH